MIQAVLNSNKFNGRYVALKSFSERHVIASGATPEEVYKKASEKGFNRPVITFVPLKDMIQIY